MEVVDKEIHEHPEKYPEIHPERFPDHPSMEEIEKEVQDFDLLYALPKDKPHINPSY